MNIVPLSTRERPTPHPRVEKPEASSSRASGNLFAVLNQEPGVEADRDRGADEVGHVEGSAACLPSDRVENKPGATAVIAGTPFSLSAKSSSSRILAGNAGRGGSMSSGIHHETRA